MKTKGRFKVIIGAVVVASLLLLVGAYSVSAANTESTQSYPPIIEKLIKEFNLDRTKVAKVFEEERQERYAEQKAALEVRLDYAVKDGTITEAQKTAILKKADEVQAKLEEIRNIDDPTERRTAMENLRTEFQTWAEKNGLDQKMYLFGGFMGGRGGFGSKGHGGFGRGFGGGLMHGRGGFGPGCYSQPSDGSASSGDATKSSLEL